MNKASTLQAHQQLKLNNRLTNPNAFKLLVLAVVCTAIAFYVYLSTLEQQQQLAPNASAESAFSGKILQHDHHKHQTPLVRKERESKTHRDPGLDIHPKDPPQAEPASATADMAPGNLILPASRVVSLDLPYLVYGTAWKKDDTERLVSEAVTHGFRFIDTACQPKHYNEPGVGRGWTKAAKDLGLERNDMFLQTKFTSIDGQDPNNIPYDHTAPLEAQVAESLEISLHNLQTPYLDSWVMHSPMPTLDETMIVYRVMEQAVDDGKVKRLGISNCYDYDTFTAIYEKARVKPSVLQNRFYEDSDWDQELRSFCEDHGIWYQSFWTLSANRHALATREAKEWAESKQLTPQTLIYAYLMSLGYGTPLDGTTSVDHMKEDIAVMERLQKGEKIFRDNDELRKFERLLGF